MSAVVADAHTEHGGGFDSTGRILITFYMPALAFLSTNIFNMLIFLFDNGIWLADGKILPICLVPNQAVSWVVGLYLVFDNVSDFLLVFPLTLPSASRQT